jgi:hypothetical protein
MNDNQTPDAEPVDPKFKELVQFVTDRIWWLQARANVLEIVVQQLALELAKRDADPQAWLQNFMSILKNAGMHGIADIADPAAGRELLRRSEQQMNDLLKDLARNGKQLEP